MPRCRTSAPPVLRRQVGATAVQRYTHGGLHTVLAGRQYLQEGYEYVKQCGDGPRSRKAYRSTTTQQSDTFLTPKETHGWEAEGRLSTKAVGHDTRWVSRTRPHTHAPRGDMEGWVLYGKQTVSIDRSGRLRTYELHYRTCGLYDMIRADNSQTTYDMVSPCGIISLKIAIPIYEAHNQLTSLEPYQNKK